MRSHLPHTATSHTDTSDRQRSSVRGRRIRRGRRALIAGAAAALLLAACGEGTDDPEDGDEADPEAIEELEDLEGLDEDPMADFEDPNEQVADGVLAANGLIVPAPEGWNFDPMAFAQGISVASAPEGLEQLAAQVLLPDALPEGMDFDTILDDARGSVDQEPDVEQDVEVTGAVRAIELRFLDLPFQQGEIDTEISEISVIAEREDGALALFNYTADVDDFDDGVAEQLLATAGFDPDSEPQPLPTGP